MTAQLLLHSGNAHCCGPGKVPHGQTKHSLLDTQHCGFETLQIVRAMGGTIGLMHIYAFPASEYPLVTRAISKLQLADAQQSEAFAFDESILH